ncbi:MAG: hypothetical protein EA397_09425 [Deltaproteobacteria bacterium]|nr:MAG: hypothetical protein EA397_09425 [Deltaproteobacteria bacterium]
MIHDPLDDLRADAALHSTWPLLEIARSTEAEALEALALVEEAVGPCPQADLLEPWELAEGFHLRIALPGLNQERWGALRAQIPDAVLRPGPSPGMLEAIDQHVVLPEVLDVQPLPATLWALTEGDGLRIPDLTDDDPDPITASIASELVAAVHGVSPELVQHPADCASFVRHRPTGRRGLRITLPHAVLEGLGGQALHQLRLDVTRAIGQVVLRRAASAHRLAPNLSWDPRFGFGVLVWRIGALGSRLPGDATLQHPLEPRRPELREAVRALLGRADQLEIQVCPSSDHDRAAMAIAEGAQGLPIHGGPSRWLRAPTPTFCPTWRLQTQDLDAVLPWIDALQNHPHVDRARVVPVAPPGIEGLDPFLEPRWQRFGTRWVVRWRDATRDRDAMVLARPRDPSPEDRQARSALVEALQRVPGLLSAEHAPSPILDSAGRHGLRIRLPAQMPSWGLGWVLGAIATAPTPALSSLVDLALPTTGPEIALWFDHPEGGAPAWGSMG